MTTIATHPAELQKRLNHVAVKAAMDARYQEPMLTGRQVHAAYMLADGSFSEAQIVSVVGCKPDDLKAWKQLPRFAALAKGDAAK